MIKRGARRLRFAFLLGATASSTQEIKDNAFGTPKDREDLTNMMNLSPGDVNTLIYDLFLKLNSSKGRNFLRKYLSYANMIKKN